jgi:hypothetical protein
MAGSHSKLSVVKLDTSGGVLTDISTYCNKVEMPQELEENDCTTFGAGNYRDYLAGFAAGTVEIGGPWTRASDNHFAPIYAAFKAGTLTSVSFEYGPEGSDSGDLKKTAELVMLSYSGAMADVSNPQEWTASFRIKTPGVTDTTY